eukprot:g242.t1
MDWSRSFLSINFLAVKGLPEKYADTGLPYSFAIEVFRGKYGGESAVLSAGKTNFEPVSNIDKDILRFEKEQKVIVVLDGRNNGWDRFPLVSSLNDESGFSFTLLLKSPDEKEDDARVLGFASLPANLESSDKKWFPLSLSWKENNVISVQVSIQHGMPPPTSVQKHEREGNVLPSNVEMLTEQLHPVSTREEVKGTEVQNYTEFNALTGLWNFKEHKVKKITRTNFKRNGREVESDGKWDVTKGKWITRDFVAIPSNEERKVETRRILNEMKDSSSSNETSDFNRFNSVNSSNTSIFSEVNVSEKVGVDSVWNPTRGKWVDPNQEKPPQESSRPTWAENESIWDVTNEKWSIPSCTISEAKKNATNRNVERELKESEEIEKKEKQGSTFTKQFTVQSWDVVNEKWVEDNTFPKTMHTIRQVQLEEEPMWDSELNRWVDQKRIVKSSKPNNDATLEEESVALYELSEKESGYNEEGDDERVWDSELNRWVDQKRIVKSSKPNNDATLEEESVALYELSEKESGYNEEGDDERVWDSELNRWVDQKRIVKSSKPNNDATLEEESVALYELSEKESGYNEEGDDERVWDSELNRWVDQKRIVKSSKPNNDATLEEESVALYELSEKESGCNEEGDDEKLSKFWDMQSQVSSRNPNPTFKEVEEMYETWNVPLRNSPKYDADSISLRGRYFMRQGFSQDRRYRPRYESDRLVYFGNKNASTMEKMQRNPVSHTWIEKEIETKTWNGKVEGEEVDEEWDPVSHSWIEKEIETKTLNGKVEGEEVDEEWDPVKQKWGIFPPPPPENEDSELKERLQTTQKMLSNDLSETLKEYSMLREDVHDTLMHIENSRHAVVPKMERKRIEKEKLSLNLNETLEKYKTLRKEVHRMLNYLDDFRESIYEEKELDDLEKKQELNQDFDESDLVKRYEWPNRSKIDQESIDNSLTSDAYYSDSPHSVTMPYRWRPSALEATQRIGFVDIEHSGDTFGNDDIEARKFQYEMRPERPEMQYRYMPKSPSKPRKKKRKEMTFRRKGIKPKKWKETLRSDDFDANFHSVKRKSESKQDLSFYPFGGGKVTRVPDKESYYTTPASEVFQRIAVDSPAKGKYYYNDGTFGSYGKLKPNYMSNTESWRQRKYM